LEETFGTFPLLFEMIQCWFNFPLLIKIMEVMMTTGLEWNTVLILAVTSRRKKFCECESGDKKSQE